MTPDELRRAVAGIQWFHHIDLGHGIVTPGRSPNVRTLQRLGLPDRLDGLTVLDIGAWDGFFSFEAERRGARRVLATDWFCWGGPGWGTKEGFELARRALHSRVEDKEIDVVDLSPQTVGVFDLVFFLGVLYHLTDPMGALERAFSVTGRQLVLETHVDLLHIRRPACAFYPGTELDRDATNWFGPNLPALVGMLRAVGFQRVDVVSRYSLPERLARAVMWRWQGRGTLWRTLNQGRAVIHAWR